MKTRRGREGRREREKGGCEVKKQAASEGEREGELGSSKEGVRERCEERRREGE